jgi:hypothetical protein
MTKLPPGTIAAWITLGGATVAMTRDNDPQNLRFDHRWSCLGCGATSRAADTVHTTRTEAAAGLPHP